MVKDHLAHATTPSCVNRLTRRCSRPREFLFPPLLVTAAAELLLVRYSSHVMMLADNAAGAAPPVLFFVLLACVVVWFILITRLFRLLRTRHPAVYDSLGRPTLILNNSIRNGWLFTRFLLGGHFRDIDDTETVRLC